MHEPHLPGLNIIHCAGHVSANTRPHQLHLGNQEMGTLSHAHNVVRRLALSKRLLFCSLKVPSSCVNNLVTLVSITDTHSHTHSHNTHSHNTLTHTHTHCTWMIFLCFSSFLVGRWLSRRFNATSTAARLSGFWAVGGEKEEGLMVGCSWQGVTVAWNKQKEGYKERDFQRDYGTEVFRKLSIEIWNLKFIQHVQKYLNVCELKQTVGKIETVLVACAARLGMIDFNNRWCLLASSVFGHMLSVSAIRFEDRFCASRKGGTGAGIGSVHLVWTPFLAL